MAEEKVEAKKEETPAKKDAFYKHFNFWLALLIIVIAGCVAAFMLMQMDSGDDKVATGDEEVITQATEVAEGSETPAVPYLNINDEAYVVDCKSGFDNAGITELLCDTDGTYVFTATGEATWNVYILDEEFDDAARYLPQANTPALKGNGSVEIKNGQYVYIECSCNAFTEDAPDDCYVSITRGETAAAADTAVAAGNYTDETSQRAVATVELKDGKYAIQINWGSSATENTVWTMTATEQDGKLVYSDCKKVNVTTADDASGETSVTEFENGTGYFEIDNGKLLWTGASEESCQDCVFAFEG